jgi:sulfur-carrier protein
MDKLYPGRGHHVEEETTVAIDGQIYETAYFQPIRPGCKILSILKLEEGNTTSPPCWLSPFL